MMKKTKMLMLAMVSVICIGAVAVGFSTCSDRNENGNGGGESSFVEQSSGAGNSESSIKSESSVKNDDEEVPVGTEGVLYAISADGTYATVTGYMGATEEVVIASVYEDVPVRVIGEAAFQKCYDLPKVIIPGSVKTIENNAFV